LGKPRGSHYPQAQLTADAHYPQARAAIVAVLHRPDNVDLADFEVVVSGRTNGV
jgi:hypothetical protein